VARSLRAGLLAWVMLPLAGAVAVDGWIGWHDAQRTALAVQDRLLLGSARMVAEQMHFEDGAFQDHIPPAALELFAARESDETRSGRSETDQIYYRVTASDGRLITGYAELQLAKTGLQNEEPRFFDAVVGGKPVRAVAYMQPVVGAPGISSVIVEMAQTPHGRSAFALELWSQSILQQVLILTLTAALILLGLRQGLQPLLRLRDAVLARAPGALQPLEQGELSVELAPLVVAINDYARRLDQFAGAQRVFIQNAAHQLRTPFTLLTTQLSYALRADDAKGRDESLRAIRDTVQQTVRLVNQLLTLSAAEVDARAAGVDQAIAIDDIVRRVLEDLAGHAQARDIDLGFESKTQAPNVIGHPVALREIVTNLVDNAIRYTLPGGVVTTKLRRDGARVVLTVEDNGPGIPQALRERVFERFFRINDGDSGGSGLGMPIVREFASRIGASVALRTPESGRGLAVDVTFEAAKESGSDAMAFHHDSLERPPAEAR
jgi:two-component system, OmpR family, sensor histidine kinase TctE